MRSSSSLLNASSSPLDCSSCATIDSNVNPVSGLASPDWADAWTELKSKLVSSSEAVTSSELETNSSLAPASTTGDCAWYTCGGPSLAAAHSLPPNSLHAA